MQLVDPWANLSRWREHPIEVMILSIGLLTLSLLLPPMPCGLVVVAVAAGAIVFGAGIPARVFLRVMFVPASFLVAGSLALIFSVGFDEGRLSVAPTPGGFATARTVLLRSLSSVSAMMLLGLTVPMSEILSLLRRWRMPAVLIELMGLIYRLLFVFDSTFQKMLTAQACRLGYRNLRTSYRSLGTALTALFIRAIDRAHRMERGLAARGYDGELRVLSCHHRVSVPAVTLILLVLAAIAAIGIFVQGGVRWPT